jgi:hypothetical protein
MYKTTLLKEELIGLERDNNSGKIDHSTSGINSKDSADAICGSIWNASQHAEELSIDFVDDIENTVAVSMTNSENMDTTQITLDFEEELKNVFAGMPKKQMSREASQLDFGFGPAISMESQFISDGIMVW